MPKNKIDDDTHKERFMFRLTPDERQKLEELAERSCRSAGDWLRLQIRTEHAKKAKTK